MARPVNWNMELAVEENNGTTRAQVRLAATDGAVFHGIGLVQGGARGVHLPEIAAELAMARALSDLTEELLEAVASDIEAAGPVLPVPARM